MCIARANPRLDRDVAIKVLPESAVNDSTRLRRFENLFLTRDGRVRILDFGLSKLVEATADERADATQPTATAAPLTGTGMLLGTVGYMAP